MLEVPWRCQNVNKLTKCHAYHYKQYQQYKYKIHVCDTYDLFLDERALLYSHVNFFAVSSSCLLGSEFSQGSSTLSFAVIIDANVPSSDRLGHKGVLFLRATLNFPQLH